MKIKLNMHLIVIWSRHMGDTLKNPILVYLEMWNSSKTPWNTSKVFKTYDHLYYLAVPTRAVYWTQLLRHLQERQGRHQDHSVISVFLYIWITPPPPQTHSNTNVQTDLAKICWIKCCDQNFHPQTGFLWD